MIGAALILAQLAMAAQVYDQAPLPDAELADLRGGIRLPNGIDAALTIETLTAINGAIVLMTVVKIDSGAPKTTVFAPIEGAEAPAPSPAPIAPGSPSLPTISFDSRNGLHIVPGKGGLPTAVTDNAAPGAQLQGGGVPDGLTQIDMGAPAQSGDGRITASVRGGLQSVELALSDLQVMHFTGNAFGSAIANSGSDRAIDTQTTVSLDLRNAGPDVLGSAMLRVADVATEAMATRF